MPDGTVLHLYYQNDESGDFELAADGTASGGKVTFEMTHCSVYIITPEDRGDSYPIETEAETEIETTKSTKETTGKATSETATVKESENELLVETAEAESAAATKRGPGKAAWSLIVLGILVAAGGAAAAVVCVLRKKKGN